MRKIPAFGVTVRVLAGLRGNLCKAKFYVDPAFGLHFDRLGTERRVFLTDRQNLLPLRRCGQLFDCL
jgi:hypothetical protein